MTIFLPPILLFAIFSCLLPVGQSVVDPLSSLIREFALNTKEAVRKFFAQLGLPHLSAPSPADGGPGPLSFQLDSPLSSADSLHSSVCPLCRQSVPPDLPTGRWHLALVSRSFRLNALSQLDSLIDRTEAGLPFSERSTFHELVADPPELICPTLTVLNASEENNSKWELAYRVPTGKFKSVVGQWERIPSFRQQQGGAATLWRVGSLVLAQFCLAHSSASSIASSSPSSSSIAPANSTPSISIVASDSQAQPQQFALLVQIDSWPPCDNLVVLTRDWDEMVVDRLRDWLEAQRAGGGLLVDGLDRLRCPR